jgi:serine/threonine protein kinase
MMKARTNPEEELDSGPDNLDLVRTEVAIMKKVDHPNIASVHEVIDVTSDDALLIVMELCRGGPIMKLKDGEKVDPYPEEKVRDIFRQLTLGEHCPLLVESAAAGQLTLVVNDRHRLPSPQRDRASRH